MDLPEAVKSGEIAVVLAVIVMALAGVVTFLFKMIVDELKRSRDRAEAITKESLAAFDKLYLITQAALDELRKR